MSIQNCVITFERINGVFYSGELVRGRINLTIGGAINVTELFLNITGDAQCKWGEVNPGRNRGTVFFSGTEVYFQTTSNLLNSVNSQQGGSIALGSGVHTFDFSFELPGSLPTSYEGIFGRVRYKAMVTIRQLHFQDMAFAVNFTVINHLDLNFYPNLMAPVKKETSRTVATLFSSTGRVQVTMDMPRSGFVAGQQVPVKCTINNLSKCQIFEVKFYLLKVTVFSANFPYSSRKTEVVKLARSATGNVKKGEQYNLDVSLIIPSVPPSTFPLVSIINISYTAKLKLVMGGLNSDIEVDVPVTIGTVPFGHQSSLGFPETQSSVPFARGGPEPPPAYGMGLPTYEESVSNPIFSSNDPGFVPSGDPTTFTPKYPVFRT